MLAEPGRRVLVAFLLGEGPTLNRSLTELQSREAQGKPLPPVQVRVRQDSTDYLHEPEGDTFSVGSDSSNAVVIKDRFISSRHLQVTRCESGLHVRDLNSTNGTYHGALRVLEAEMPLNTVLRLGRTEVLFEPVSQQGQPPAHGLIGNAPAMRLLVECLERIASVQATVTILGESGTGKALVARALHGRLRGRQRGHALPGRGG